jgi:hypothetical protein
MFRIGQRVKSKRTINIVGSIIGYGSLTWPQDDKQLTGDDEQVPVYLVRIGKGSSSLGPACAVLRADQVVPV